MLLASAAGRLAAVGAVGCLCVGTAGATTAGVTRSPPVCPILSYSRIGSIIGGLDSGPAANAVRITSTADGRLYECDASTPSPGRGFFYTITAGCNRSTSEAASLFRAALNLWKTQAKRMPYLRVAQLRIGDEAFTHVGIFHQGRDVHVRRGPIIFTAEGKGFGNQAPAPLSILVRLMRASSSFRCQ